jgi:hypothetical protein
MFSSSVFLEKDTRDDDDDDDDINPFLLSSQQTRASVEMGI